VVFFYVLLVFIALPWMHEDAHFMGAYFTPNSLLSVLWMMSYLLHPSN
jgi:hypothetical protein